MGEYNDFRLLGWYADGSPLPVDIKQEIQKFVRGICTNEYCTACDLEDPHIVSFCNTSFHSAVDTFDALHEYAEANPQMLFELWHECEDNGVYTRIRIRGNEGERNPRVVLYPPFNKLTFKGDDSNSLPVVEFRFGDESILVLLEYQPTKHTLDELQDSVFLYSPPHPDVSHEKMIHDVLLDHDIRHWIIKPMRAFDI